MQFYVYRHIRLDSNTPFYVGKGSGKRATFKTGRSKYWKNIVNKAGYRVEVVKRFTNESDAYRFESKLIQLYWELGYCEANFSKGGIGGNKGLKLNKDMSVYKSDKFRNIMSKATTGENNGMFGKTHTEAVRKKLSNLASSRKGSKNPRFKGYWVCGEYGKFGSYEEAQKVIGSKCVFYRCKQSKSEKWKDWYFEPIKED